MAESFTTELPGLIVCLHSDMYLKVSVTAEISSRIKCFPPLSLHLYYFLQKDHEAIILYCIVFVLFCKQSAFVLKHKALW